MQVPMAEAIINAVYLIKQSSRACALFSRGSVSASPAKAAFTSLVTPSKNSSISCKQAVDYPSPLLSSLPTFSSKPVNSMHLPTSTDYARREC